MTLKSSFPKRKYTPIENLPEGAVEYFINNGDIEKTIKKYKINIIKYCNLKGYKNYKFITMK